VHDVLGSGGIADQAAREAADRRVVREVRLFDGVAVTLAKSRDEIAVRGRFGARGLLAQWPKYLSQLTN
jgi:hypothetical protein